MTGEDAQTTESARLVGGPYDGVRVGADLPDVILVGVHRERYEVVFDPDTCHRLDAYVHNPLPSGCTDDDAEPTYTPDSRCPDCGTVLLGSAPKACINCHRYVDPKEVGRG